MRWCSQDPNVHDCDWTEYCRQKQERARAHAVRLYGWVQGLAVDAVCVGNGGNRRGRSPFHGTRRRKYHVGLQCLHGGAVAVAVAVAAVAVAVVIAASASTLSMRVV